MPEPTSEPTPEPTSEPTPEPVLVTPHDLAHGGEAVGRVDGKTIFVAGVMPGEQAKVRILKDKGSWARAELIEIVSPSPDRIDPRCKHFGECGGCQWQFADASIQMAWKRNVVTSQLEHLARFADVDVRDVEAPGPAFGYRNRMDFTLSEGRPALYKAGSRIPVAIVECHLLVPPLVELFERLGDVDGLNSLTIRAGVHTGDLLAIVTGRLPKSAKGWGVPIARVRRGTPSVEHGQMHLFEQVGDHRFRISANGFFQNNTWGADALVRLVTEALEPERDDVLLDAYAGGGLFSVSLGGSISQLIAVETSPLGLRDLEYNLEAADGPAADIVPIPFEESLGEYDGWTIAVCDPPRTGLGEAGVDALLDARPRRVAYVSCDPASFARDARLIVDSGYSLEWVAPVDMFPQTFHIETVARFDRVDPVSPI